MTTALLAPTPVFKAFDNQGSPLAGGLLYSYVAGTSTPQATYPSQSEATPNTNPIKLNARGECALWLDPNLNYKVNLTDSEGNQIPGWPVDNIQSANGISEALIESVVTQTYIGTTLWPQTAAEKSANITPTYYYYEPYNVKRYGAVGDSLTNDTAAFVAGLAVAEYSGELYVPGVSSYYLIQGNLYMPAVTITIYGDGSQSQIYQNVPGDSIFNATTTWATATNFSQFHDLYLASNGGQYGIKLNGTCRSSIRNCSFAGFTSNATSAGIGIIDSLILQIEGNWFSTCFNGIYAVGSTNTAWNGGCLRDNDFEAMTAYALQADYLNGVTISGNTIESSGTGGISVYNGGGGFSIGGNYFEANSTGAAGATEFADIFLGLNSYINGVEISGNYFNGNNSAVRTITDYVPIRIKYATGIVVEGNTLNTGSNFVNFETGCNVYQCRFGLIGFHAAAGAAFDYSITATATYAAGTASAPTALPSIFNTVGNGVTIEGLNRIAGTINQANLRTRDLPIQVGMWTVTGTNGGMTADGQGAYVDTTATASSTAIAVIESLGLSSSEGQSNINYSNEVIATFMVSNVTAGTSTGASWLMLTNSVGAADPATVSMGFKIIDNEIWGLCYGSGTLTLTDLSLALSAGILTELRVVSNGNVTWYVNGVQAGIATSDVPTGVVQGNLVISAANGANSARQRLGIYGCQLSVSQ